jgi:hypothetical protein
MNLDGPHTTLDGFLSTAQALRDKIGEERFIPFLEALPPPTAEMIRRRPRGVKWVPASHFLAVIRIARQDLFAGDLDAVVDVGRRTLVADLGGIYKAFIRLMSPQFIIDRAAQLFESYNRNYGQLRAKATGRGSAEITFTNIPDTCDAYWSYQRGAILACVQMTGVKGGGLTIVEGGGETGQCRMRVEWDA